MAKTGRNDPCSCGSGRKYKKCCELKNPEARRSRLLMIAVGVFVAGALLAAVVSVTTNEGGGGTRVWDPAHGHYHDANGFEIP
jgi:hypothetical protein